MLFFSLDTVISLFKDDSYTLISPEDNLEGRVFYVDCHCTDMLVFPPESREYILEHDLLHSGHVIMQVRKKKFQELYINICH